MEGGAVSLFTDTDLLQESAAFVEVDRPAATRATTMPPDRQGKERSPLNRLQEEYKENIGSEQREFQAGRARKCSSPLIS